MWGDDEVVERVRGCQRCAEPQDLICALRTLALRRHPPKRIFVELTGWAGPAIAAQNILFDPWLSLCPWGLSGLSCTSRP